MQKNKITEKQFHLILIEIINVLKMEVKLDEEIKVTESSSNGLQSVAM